MNCRYWKREDGMNRDADELLRLLELAHRRMDEDPDQRYPRTQVTHEQRAAS